MVSPVLIGPWAFETPSLCITDGVTNPFKVGAIYLLIQGSLMLFPRWHFLFSLISMPSRKGDTEVFSLGGGAYIVGEKEYLLFPGRVLPSVRIGL